QALKFQPDFAEADFALKGISLVEAGGVNEVVWLCRLRVRNRPNQPEAHAFLFHALVVQGRFDEALTTARRGLEASPKAPIFPVGLLKLFERETEQCIALEPHLPAYVKGERKPRDAQELAILVILCYCKQQYLGAARLYSHAFAAEPGLTEDVT